MVNQDAKIFSCKNISIAFIYNLYTKLSFKMGSFSFVPRKHRCQGKRNAHVIQALQL